MRTSYSALDTFQQCPQKFKFQVIDKIKAPRSPEASFGSAVHGSLKYMFSHDPVFPTIEEVTAHFSENWKTSSFAPSLALTPEVSELYNKSGREMLKNFYKRNPPWNFSVVDTESHFEVLLTDEKSNKTHILAGIIDRVDKIGEGEYEIIDYKTNRRLPSQKTVDDNLQMSIYHMALMRRWPGLDPKKIKLSLYFLKHDEKMSSFRTPDKLSEIRERVIATIYDVEKRLSNSNFPPNPSKLCDYCPYKSICPAWKHLYKKGETDSFDEATLQKALQEYFSLKDLANKNDDRLSELQEIIKSYMDTNGLERVFDERGYYISKKLQKRFKYDFDKVREILMTNGLENQWEGILSADDKKLKLILGALPYHIRKEIEEQKILHKEFTVLSASTKPVKK